MNEEHKNKFKNLDYLIYIAIFLFVAVVFIYFVLFKSELPNTKENFGVLGDFIGGSLNPLLAFFSLYAIIYTIKIQIQELEYTREELKATKEEMAKSREAQEEQSESFKIQNLSIKQQTFENTFFKLFDQYNYKLNKLREPDNDTIIDKIIYTRGRRFLDVLSNNNNGTIQSYFMLFYHILKFIDEEHKKFDNKEFFNPKLYINLIKTTLENRLLLILAVYCTYNDCTEFKGLIEEYSFLEHFNPSADIFLQVDHKKIYHTLWQFDTKIFGNNEEIIKNNIDFYMKQK